MDAVGRFKTRVRRGFRLMGADLRKLPPAVRRRIAAYRVKPRPPLADANGRASAIVIAVLLVCLCWGIRLLIVGPGWWHLLGVPVLVMGAALVTRGVWYVQRPALPRKPGFIVSFLERRNSREP